MIVMMNIELYGNAIILNEMDACDVDKYCGLESNDAICILDEPCLKEMV